MLPCGSGPTVTLDDARPTQVRGTLSDLESLRPMGLAVCGGPTTIAAGDHVLQAGRLGGAFKVTSLQALPATEPKTPASRSTRIVGTWGAANRQIKVGPGAESYLAVAQNYNTGWKAVLNGRSLTPVRLDGWQQGWIVPAGAGGTVVMTFPADAWYRLALLVGAFFVAALAVFVLAAAPGGPRRRPPSASRCPGSPSGSSASSCSPSSADRSRWSSCPWPMRATLGPPVLAVVAGCAFVAAGIAVASIPGAEPPMGVGAFGWPVQLLAAIALGAVLAALVLPEEEADPAPLAGLPTGERAR